MKFIDKGNKVGIEIAANRGNSWYLLSSFDVRKEDFEDFLDHIIKECKAAYGNDDLFPSIKNDEVLKEALEKAKDQIFICMMCGKESKGITCCDHNTGDEETK